VSKFSVFWQSENSITADSLNQRFNVPRKQWEYSSFLKAENAILPSREIHVSKLPSFVGAILPQVPSFV